MTTRTAIGIRYISSTSRLYRSPFQSPTFADHQFNQGVVSWLLCEGLKYRGEHDEHDHINRFALCIAGFVYNEPSPL
jgi:hypothetical protein